jgi:hypothetical protein
VAGQNPRTPCRRNARNRRRARFHRRGERALLRLRRRRPARCCGPNRPAGASARRRCPMWSTGASSLRSQPAGRRESRQRAHAAASAPSRCQHLDDLEFRRRPHMASQHHRVRSGCRGVRGARPCQAEVHDLGTALSPCLRRRSSRISASAVMSASRSAPCRSSRSLASSASRSHIAVSDFVAPGKVCS